MTKLFQSIRYFKVQTRRKGRLAFSSRDAVSLVLLAGLPFVMVSSLSINQSLHRNMAYAYVAQDSSGDMSADNARVLRHVAAQIKGDPDTFLKIKGSQLLAMFNQPGLERHEGNMAVWQYRSAECVIDLYVAEQGQGNVTYYDMRARVKAGTLLDDTAAFDLPQKRACVQSVLNGHDGIKTMQVASR
ncbi:MAG: hypothetical protein ACK4NR_10345 [Micavibrio sp.]